MSDNEETLFWREYKKAKAEKRAENKEASTKMLVEEGVRFKAKNGGSHLIVEDKYDFWPSTGLWWERGHQNPKRKRGVIELIQHIKERK